MKKIFRHRERETARETERDRETERETERQSQRQRQAETELSDCVGFLHVPTVDENCELILSC